MCNITFITFFCCLFKLVTYILFYLILKLKLISMSLFKLSLSSSHSHPLNSLFIILHPRKKTHNQRLFLTIHFYFSGLIFCYPHPLIVYTHSHLVILWYYLNFPFSFFCLSFDSFKVFFLCFFVEEKCGKKRNVF